MRYEAFQMKVGGKQMKISILLSAVLFGALFHSSPSTAASRSAWGKIKTVEWYEGHTGVLVIQENMSDLGGCGRSDYYILDDQHPYFNQIYSMLLVAHVSDQPLSLSIQDCVQGISRIKHVISSR